VPDVPEEARTVILRVRVRRGWGSRRRVSSRLRAVGGDRSGRRHMHCSGRRSLCRCWGRCPHPPRPLHPAGSPGGLRRYPDAPQRNGHGSNPSHRQPRLPTASTSLAGELRAISTTHTLTSITSITLLLRNMSDFVVLNSTYTTYFSLPLPPSRVCVSVPGLQRNALCNPLSHPLTPQGDPVQRGSY